MSRAGHTKRSILKKINYTAVQNLPDHKDVLYLPDSLQFTPSKIH